MKNTQRGFLKFFIIIVCAIFVVGLVVITFLYLQTYQALNEARTQSNQTYTVSTSIPPTASIVSSTQTIIPTTQIPSGWKQYNNQQYGISFAYPQDWTLTVDSTGSLVTVSVSAIRQNIEGQYGNTLVDSSWKISVAKQCYSKTCNSSPENKTIVFDDTHSYETTIDFMVNGRYSMITELWSVNGNADAVNQSIKSPAVNILNQITSSAVVK